MKKHYVCYALFLWLLVCFSLGYPVYSERTYVITETQLNNFRQTIQALKIELSVLQKGLIELAKNPGDVEKLLTIYKQALADYEKALKTLKKQITDYESQIENLKNSEQTLNQEIEFLKNQVIELEKTLKSLNDSFRKLRKTQLTEKITISVIAAIIGFFAGWLLGGGR